METGGEDFLESLIERPALLEAIQIFAHRPQLWIEKNRLADWSVQQDQIDDPTLLNRMFSEENPRRLQRSASSILASKFGLAEIDYAMFSEVRWRFALLVPEILQSLAYCVGLLRCSPALGALIRREEVARVVEQIGEKDYRLAVDRGPLTLGLGNGGVPLLPEDLSGNLQSALARTGWNSIGQVLSGAPGAIVQRLRLKLTESGERDLDSGMASGNSDPNLYGLLVRILKNHVDRRAALCVF